MERDTQEPAAFWPTLILSSVSIVAIVFAAWELVENRFFRDVDYVTLHYLYITRGIASSLLLAVWAGWYVFRQRQRSERELRRSREHYRHLLEASPGAVALYDSSLTVVEWNATAEHLYGFSKSQVLGTRIPTIPEEKENELRLFMERVRGGESILNQETVRRNRGGQTIDVQLSLLPFRGDSKDNYFLDVTTDFREYVQLRQTLLEVEKLTSMGRMAAGTAHHLNTPLAAMLLRVQMMRERLETEDLINSDLDRMESGLHFCEQFVSRLLEFARRPATQKQPEEVTQIIESIVSFFAPTITARQAHVSVKLDDLDSAKILADRNLLEVLFSTLLSNALDVVEDQGAIEIRCCLVSSDTIEIRFSDDGHGITEADRPRVFEPFFTTKEAGKGTGLGLAIARNIVLEHDGSIRLEAATPRGTVAIIEFPVHVAATTKEEYVHESS